MEAFIAWSIGQLPGIILGVIGGAIGMFFVAQKNPKWVQTSTRSRKGRQRSQGTKSTN